MSVDFLEITSVKEKLNGPIGVNQSIAAPIDVLILLESCRLTL